MKLKDKNIAVIGSGLTGLETAEFLQQWGNHTLIVEMLDTIAPDAYVQNLLDVKSRLRDEKTEYLPSHRLIAIDDHSIELKNTKTDETVTRKVDAVVLSVGYRPDSKLIDSFKDIAPTVMTIGDADSVKNIGMAVRSGFRGAYSL